MTRQVISLSKATWSTNPTPNVPPREIAGLMIRAYKPLVSLNKAGYLTLISAGTGMLGEGGPQLTSHQRSTGVAPLPPLKEDFDVNTPNLKEDFDVNAHSEEGGKSFGFVELPGGEVRGCFPQKAGDEMYAVSGTIYFVAGQPICTPQK